MATDLFLWERVWNATGSRILKQSKGNASENRESRNEKKRLLGGLGCAIGDHGHTAHVSLIE